MNNWRNKCLVALAAVLTLFSLLTTADEHDHVVNGYTIKNMLKHEPSITRIL